MKGFTLTRNDTTDDEIWVVEHPPVYTLETFPDTFNVEKPFIDSICDDPDKYGVDMVINGHVHTDCICYLVNE